MITTKVTIHDHAKRVSVPFRTLETGSYFTNEHGVLFRKVAISHTNEGQTKNAEKVNGYHRSWFCSDYPVFPQDITVILNDPTPAAQPITVTRNMDQFAEI